MNAIEVRNLNKLYKANKVSSGFELKDVSFDLPYGCIMGLIGENGAGKSTTIKLILDIIEKDSGTIRIFGKESPEELVLAKDDIGVVIDEPVFHDSMTGAQINKIMRNTYTNWDEAKFFELLERFGVEKGKRFKTLSKGMKMKMSIAVALSHKAKLLVMDEPTSGLDPVIRNDIVDIFNEFTRDPQNSVLISSHIVSDLEKLCDYVAFISRGQLLLCEEKDRLLERYAVVYCFAEELAAIPEKAVKGKKESPYGVEAVVERSAIPEGIQANPVSMEELFVLFVKEGKAK